MLSLVKSMRNKSTFPMYWSKRIASFKNEGIFKDKCFVWKISKPLTVSLNGKRGIFPNVMNFLLSAH